jgi:DNA-binding CsgD family transcriptional regulator
MARIARQWPVIGRNRLVEEALRALEKGSGVLLMGPPGVGKTALAGEIVAQWEHGPATWLRPVGELRRVPLGSVALLLGSEPAAAPDGSLAEYSLAPAAATLASRVGDGLLVVDDAHHLDEASAGLIHQLASLAGLPVVLTARADEVPPTAVTRLWVDELVVRIDVEPLGPDAVAELLAAVLEGPVDAGLADETHARTLGSPLFIRELITAAVDEDLLSNQGGRWHAKTMLRAPARVAELVQDRLRSLPPDVRAAFDLVAVADAVPLDVLEAACPPGAISTLEERQLAVVDGDVRPFVRVAHPLLGEVGAGLLPAAERRAALRKLADLFAPRAHTKHDRARVLRWQLLGGADVPPADVAEGARAALAVGDVDLAARASEVAFRVDPTFANGLLRAMVLLRTEQHAEAVAALDAVAHLATTQDDVVALTQSRTQILAYGQGRGQAAADALAEGRHRLASRPGDPLAHMEAALLLYEGLPVDALHLVAGAVERGDGSAAAVYGGVVASIAQLLTGQLDACLVTCRATDAAIEAGTRTDPLGDHHMAEVVRLLARMEMGDLRAAAADGERYWTTWSAGAEGSPWSHWLAWVLGRGALLRGRAGEAVRWFRRSETTVSGSLPAILGSWVAGSRAYAELLTGDASAAAQLADKPDPISARIGDDGADRARGWILAQRGAGAEALAVLASRADELAGRSVRLFEATIRHDLVRLGLADPATVDHLAELARVMDGELSNCRAAHGAALAAGDPGALGAAAEQFEALGADLFAAEAAAQGADLARRRDERRAAALTALAARCRERCDVVTSPSLTPVGAPGGLTRREREIAERAAAGKPSKEIAVALGISRRTVDNTLQRVFVKLGVARRGDLADHLSAS